MKIRLSLVMLSIIVSLLCANTVLFAVEINVPEDQPTIQDGILMAKDGDTILVAAGIYEGKGNVNVDFGGKQITVRSISGAENTIIDCGEIQDTRGFVFNKGESAATILDGFTIKNGVHKEGAGIFINSASPTIRNCIITENSAGDSANYSGKGGGIYCFDSNAFIEGCTITRNFVGSRFGGGGIYLGGESNFSNSRAELILLNCDISDNTGHGVYSKGYVTVTIQGCTVSKNTMRGIVCTANYARSINLITNSRIEQNMEGGVEVSEETVLNITKSIIRKNSARSGAGISCSRTCTLYVSDCVITDNIADNYGGGLGIETWSGKVTISHTTITGNTSRRIGGGIYFGAVPTERLRMTIKDSIVWGNRSDGSYDELALSGSAIVIKNSDIRGGLEGIGREAEPNRLTYTDNIDEDPLFIDPENGDFRLMENSPAAAMGANPIFSVAGPLTVTAKGKRISKWAEFKRR